MISISSIFEVFVIAEILAFFGQLSIIFPLPLQLKHLLFFISRDVSTSKFQGVRVIISRNVLDRHEKEVLLLDTVGAWEELVTALRGTLAVICTIVEDLAFFLI